MLRSKHRLLLVVTFLFGLGILGAGGASADNGSGGSGGSHDGGGSHAGGSHDGSGGSHDGSGSGGNAGSGGSGGAGGGGSGGSGNGGGAGGGGNAGSGGSGGGNGGSGGGNAGNSGAASAAPSAHGGPASAPNVHSDQAAQNRAAEAVRNGEVAPLNQVLAAVRRVVPGDVLNIALDRGGDGSWTYTVSILTRDGEYCDVAVDAARSKLLTVTYR